MTRRTLPAVCLVRRSGDPSEWTARATFMRMPGGRAGVRTSVSSSPASTRPNSPNCCANCCSSISTIVEKLGEAPKLEDYQGTYPAVDFEPFAELFTAAAQPAAPSFDKQAIQSTPFNSRATTSDAPLLGRLNDYELLEEIGRGGMGVVFKARQVRLDRTVAVKMVLAGGFATSTERERFHCEARAAALLDHPNILPVYEVGEHEGRQYYSMGYVDGQSLDARLAAGPLPPKEAAELAATLAEAVEYAHGQGVIHRDIKPSNILIDREGRPRVADFGLAKRLGAPGTPGHGSDLTVTGQILGTPSYMAPEQAAGQVEAVAPTADVYALGALLYAMLTGRPPFQAASALETLRQVREREPAALRQLNAAVPRDLETIVLKCLEKPAARRYATARRWPMICGAFSAADPSSRGRCGAGSAPGGGAGGSLSWRR